MPNYEFYCNKCQNEEEKFLSMSKRHEKQICSKCAEVLTRLIGTGSSIVFKGEGWPTRDSKQYKDCTRKAQKNLKKNK